MENIKATVYTSRGKLDGFIELPLNLFDVPWNGDLVHQIMTSMQSNIRGGLAHSKDRSEVRGGGKKPWRQKGTGNARHGSRRSPIWVGGGITFGPRNAKNYSKKINKKMRAKALAVILSQKLRDGQILFVKDLGLSRIKTKDAQKTLEIFAKLDGFSSLLTKKKNTALIVSSKYSANTLKSFQNIPGFFTEEIRNMNPLHLLSTRYLIITNPKESLSIIQRRIIDIDSRDKIEQTEKEQESVTA